MRADMTVHVRILCVQYMLEVDAAASSAVPLLDKSHVKSAGGQCILPT